MTNFDNTVAQDHPYPFTDMVSGSVVTLKERHGLYEALKEGNDGRWSFRALSIKGQPLVTAAVSEMTPFNLPIYYCLASRHPGEIVGIGLSCRSRLGDDVHCALGMIAWSRLRSDLFQLLFAAGRHACSRRYGSPRGPEAMVAKGFCRALGTVSSEAVGSSAMFHEDVRGRQVRRVINPPRPVGLLGKPVQCAGACRAAFDDRVRVKHSACNPFGRLSRLKRTCVSPGISIDFYQAPLHSSRANPGMLDLEGPARAVVVARCHKPEVATSVTIAVTLYGAFAGGVFQQAY